MAAEEKVPLVRSSESFREVSQHRAVCGCPTWCARVPVLSSFFRKKEPHEEVNCCCVVHDATGG